MRNNKEILDFCKAFTYSFQKNIERNIGINHVRDCVIMILSRCNSIDENLHMKFLGAIDDI